MEARGAAVGSARMAWPAFNVMSAEQKCSTGRTPLILFACTTESAFPSCDGPKRSKRHQRLARSGSSPGKWSFRLGAVGRVELRG
jgi:hypothetical protein